MTVIRSYRDLLVWQKAVELSANCYALTKRFPATERYGLASQIQRAAVSIAANIAEGHGRNGPALFLHHLSVARGSLRELETLLILADRLGYSKAETQRDLSAATDEVGRMLYGLSTKLSASRAAGVVAGTSDQRAETRSAR
ncbi:MAG TPA: four helix bundle protein [Gemmatimonadaceae bacterium]|jgi:four helix bundle protein